MYHGNYLNERLRAGQMSDDAVFLVNDSTGDVVLYGDFFDAAERVAAALVRAGVKPGDRVAVQAPKTVAMLELYIGVVLAGAVFLPLNTGYTTREVQYFLQDAEPVLFVCDVVREVEMQAIAQGITVWTIGADEAGSLAKYRDAEATGFEAVARSADDLAAILYTSGTTGRSKGAMMTHRNLAANAEVLVETWGFTADDVLIHALPIFHTHGLFVATNVTLMAGSSLIFMAKFDAAAVVERMSEATVLMGVPTFYVRLLGETGLSNASAAMRLFVSGSAPLLAETHQKWREVTGHAILERYGMTETNMNTSNPYEGERRAGTVGFALPGVEVKICDANGVALPDGEIGMLEIRGPNVFAGYWRMPEKTAAELRENGFFISGDLAMIDADGYVNIVGRDKDLIITGGYNVYPKEVELVVDAVPGVVESAVIGVAHKDFGEAVVAVVVGTVVEADVLAAMRDGIARFKQPKRVVVVKALPRNAMGKVQKNVLRKEFSGLFEG